MDSQRRILTSHVGSLVRPPELVELLAKKRAGERIERARLEVTLDEAVTDVVRRQAETGIDIVDDGEFGKSTSWFQYVQRRLRGVERRTDVPIPGSFLLAKDRLDFAEFYAEYEDKYGVAGMGVPPASPDAPRPVLTAVGPITYCDEEVRADIARLKAAMKAAGVEQGFLPVVAPISAAYAIADLHYGGREALLFGVAEALREEYKAIIDAGLVVQIDDAFLATEYDCMVPAGPMSAYRQWAEIAIEATNHALRGLPQDRVRYHVCWGSWNGPHTNDVNARDIVDLILRVNAGGYALEMANPRHEHEWRVWETTKLPEGKTLLPGVVSHSTNVVEHPELVCERIVRLAKLVGRENVIASTDCGFAQGAFARRVHPSIQWAKLSSIVEGARLATTALWG